MVAAENDSFQVQAQQAAVEVAQREVERMRAGHTRRSTSSPITKTNLLLSASSSSSPGLETDARNIGLQLSIPIYQGGAVSSRTREAIANRSAALSSLEVASAARPRSTRGTVPRRGQRAGADPGAQRRAGVGHQRAGINRLGYEVGVPATSARLTPLTNTPNTSGGKPAS